ncbi:FecCD family ABC transporter permease [Listeria ivanovii]|uniref:Probable heme-iron transport system permease protein IsdF n=1 Tax=Listeria ivanovii (strain ATCC BAA-678 / PAM 55) TaxID=881621 RepID=G2ZE07_LISIP|nr:iron ABC transporter permease [Listeria ivanovii]AHI56696.1 ABC transporter permease [Listeria ivanovii WSLC3009]AIS66113.1 ABC transporter permease [Listeria ivanovii subsp. ivanovii]MBC1760351.1 iron ABC transporter permease [Listeria ivanovii]MCJ1716919.1 iron ABC transporter permease [Listeria ivanovii]MCJ1722131.1 iron ABC transporter permease [Listeria ivanovii]
MTIKQKSYFGIVAVLLIGTFLWAIQAGSLSVSIPEFIKGLFTGGNETVEVIIDLRFPRIILALLAGAALSVSGLLLQAVMRNPLADAGVIGISAGAKFFSFVILLFLPELYFWLPLFSFIGGALACFLVFFFSYRSDFNPLRFIIIGIAINAVFTGLSDALSSQVALISSQTASNAASLAMKKWSDVETLFIYVALGLICAWVLAKWCNVLGLENKMARGFGVPVNRTRIWLALIAVLLASITTAIVGVIAFVGLLVPHIARKLVGGNYQILVPFSILFGALLLLVADTIGRTLFEQMEIPASVIMLIIGGPFLIFLMRKGDFYGSKGR